MDFFVCRMGALKGRLVPLSTTAEGGVSYFTPSSSKLPVGRVASLPQPIWVMAALNFSFAPAAASMAR